MFIYDIIESIPEICFMEFVHSFTFSLPLIYCIISDIVR